MKQIEWRKWEPYLALLMIGVGTAVFYAPSVKYGIFWDDPVWYGHAVGKTWWQTLLPSTDYQFYRPFSNLYVWFFLRSDGTFAFEWLHIWQIVYHLLNTILAFAISRRLGLSRWAGVAVSLLLASYPFLYQAVAWAAPNQPMAGLWQTAAWLAYMMARPLPDLDAVDGHLVEKRPFWLVLSLLFFLLALLVQESSLAVAVVPLLYEFFLRQKIQDGRSLWSVLQTPRQSSWGMALVYPLLALLYGLIWLGAPRQTGIVQLALSGETAVYLLQGLVYPLAGRPLGTAALVTEWFVWWAAAVLIILLGLAIGHKRGRLALLALVWAAISLGPAFVGLEFDYVALASRLLYAAALPVVLIWVAALWPSPRLKWRLSWIGPLVLLLIVGQSAWLLRDMALDFARGTTHLNGAIEMMAQGNGRYLFINFPDRYEDRQPPYPFGYWGLTLAPVVVDLAEFVPLVGDSGRLGETAVSASYSMPWLDLAEREAGPYQVDMRGVIIQPGELAQLAADGAVVYVSRYGVDGRFQLQLAGQLGADARAADCLARFEETICLHSLDYALGEAQVEVRLVWSTERPLPPNQTIFVHLGQPGQPPLAQADGDTWRGLLPLADWPPGRLVTEQRTLSRAAGDGLILQIGVYDRETGQRLLTDTAVDYVGVVLE